MIWLRQLGFGSPKDCCPAELDETRLSCWLVARRILTIQGLVALDDQYDGSSGSAVEFSVCALFQCGYHFDLHPTVRRGTGGKRWHISATRGWFIPYERSQTCLCPADYVDRLVVVGVGVVVVRGSRGGNRAGK